MDNIKSDKYYIEKVKENIDAIISYTANKSYDEFVSDEYRQEHSKIAWGQIIGFRNKIVHDYGKTDYSVVYEIISADIYELKEELI